VRVEEEKILVDEEERFVSLVRFASIGKVGT
jgi:hypothetical protein